jgi:hypothetical protein
MSLQYYCPVQFLFHTVIMFDDVPVYYTIFKDRDHYFAELLENPRNVIEAASFIFSLKNGELKSSILLTSKQTQVLIEELESREINRN